MYGNLQGSLYRSQAAKVGWCRGILSRLITQAIESHGFFQQSDQPPIGRFGERLHAIPADETHRNWAPQTTRLLYRVHSVERPASWRLRLSLIGLGASPPPSLDSAPSIYFAQEENVCAANVL